ncbi:MAG: hypothetical protein Q8P34_11090 [Bacteroidota bacterium]|nr:hypothetical protein [Bacteroidota bacterium]
MVHFVAPDFGVSVRLSSRRSLSRTILIRWNEAATRPGRNVFQRKIMFRTPASRRQGMGKEQFEKMN